MSIASSKAILSSACNSLGLSVVAVSKHKHFFHVYFKNDWNTIKEKIDLIQEQFHKDSPSRFYIMLDWDREDSHTFDKVCGKAMDGKGIHSGINVIDRETELGSMYTFLFIY